MVFHANILKTPRKYIQICDCTAQAVQCGLFSPRYIFNYTQTAASEIINYMEYDIEKDSNHQGMKIIRFKNIFWVSQIVIVPGAV